MEKTYFYEPETGFMDVFQQKGMNVLDCDFSALPGTSCYCSPESAGAIRERIAGMELRAVHLTGTGDYHYQTLFWLERMREPFSLVLVDNHPDDQEDAFGEELLSCGNWVRHARRLPLLESVLWIRSEDDARGLEQLRGKLLYLSVDTDVLSGEYASTDWDQGSMTLPSLCSVVRRAAATGRLAGADICGGITESKGGTAHDFAINSACYSAILSSLSGAFPTGGAAF